MVVALDTLAQRRPQAGRDEYVGNRGWPEPHGGRRVVAEGSDVVDRVVKVLRQGKRVSLSAFANSDDQQG